MLNYKESYFVGNSTLIISILLVNFFSSSLQLKTMNANRKKETARNKTKFEGEKAGKRQKKDVLTISIFNE